MGAMSSAIHDSASSGRGLIPICRSVVRRLFHAILPTACAACGRALDDDPVPFMCRTCWAAIQPLRGPACPRCGQPYASPVALQHSPEHLCSACRLRAPAYTRAWSLYAYEPPLRDAIRLFKYHGKVSLANAFGALLGQALPALPECDFVMAVPLHPTRLREREFNQSLLLADRLAPRLRKPVAVGTLIRTRATEPQTELTRSARRANLRRAFAVPHPEEVTDKRILLVDDVMTTGTTVNECAKALRRAGSSDVYVLTLARTI